MPLFLLKLVPAFIPERFRKLAAIATLVVVAIGLFFIGKALYDRSVIKKHDAERNAKIEKANRKADATAGEQRRVDDKRAQTEAQEVKEAVNEARQQGRDPRAAYYECVRLQQAARASRQPSPDC